VAADLDSAAKMYNTGHQFLQKMLTDMHQTGGMNTEQVKGYSALAQACFAGAQARAILDSLTNLNQEKP
jgi:hypothetical protein